MLEAEHLEPGRQRGGEGGGAARADPVRSEVEAAQRQVGAAVGERGSEALGAGVVDGALEQLQPDERARVARNDRDLRRVD